MGSYMASCIRTGYLEVMGLAYCPLVAGKRAETLLEMMLFIEMFTLQRAWSGLTDDELMWEPAEGTWTVRPVTESRTATPFVTGALAAHFDAGLVVAAAEGRAIRFWGYGEPGPMGTGAQIVGSVLNEVSHHGTQIGVLRDLYRLRAPT
jgi:hypothetical protein